MNRLVEFEGKDQLVEAVETIAGDNPPDLVVVRGLLTNPDILRNLCDLVGPFESLAGHTALRGEIPQFQEADKVIAERWAEVGYNDHPTIHDAKFDMLITSTIDTHVDPVSRKRKRIEAIAQASLCLSGNRIYMAELLPHSFKDEQGNLDVDGMNLFSDFDAEFTTSIRAAGRKPRTQTEVAAGDLALFPHHPLVTLHAVGHDTGKSSVARLINWYAAGDPSTSSN